ncbi:MAG: YccS family putative transporter [Prolixibacteraceae bacterium]
MLQFSHLLKKQSWYEPFRRAFWCKPDRLQAIKTTFVIGLLAIPFVLAGQAYYAITLGLGALAGALSETDDHPKGRIKSLALKVLSFAIASISVELFYPYPILLGIGLSVSTILLIWIGGIGERYRGVTFGTLLVGIYAMIGAEISPIPYVQSLLLTSGALIYGLFSLLLLYMHPWRPLEEQLAKGFEALSNYLGEKARLFPSDAKMQAEIRTKLSLLNVQTVNALDSCKDVLNSYADALQNETALKPYLHYFMVLQSLHERAASSHDRYDLLSKDPKNSELLEGIGQTLRQLAHATDQFAYHLLIDVPYRHPSSLEWMVKAINELVINSRIEPSHPLVLLVSNLDRSNASLKNTFKNKTGDLSPKLAKDPRSILQRLKDQLKLSNPRMRYGMRLSVAFGLGFAISEIFNLAKGEWIVLTILFVLQPSYGETRRRFFQRILGTMSGVIIGILTVQLLTPPGQLLFMLLSSFLFMIWMKKKYSVAVIFITTFVLCAFNLIADKGVAVMTPRLIDTIIGAVIAFICVRVLWPEWQSKRLPGLLADALRKNTSYFRLIINEYEQLGTGDDLPYRIARREAHRADNALVLAWQNMQLEPQKQQLFRKQAFTLTYLNHALLSYLSALGAHREQHRNNNAEIIELANTIFEVLQCAEKWLQLNDNMEKKSVLNILDKIKIRLHETQHEQSNQQFILLYNIAEVTGQLLAEAEAFHVQK